MGAALDRRGCGEVYKGENMTITVIAIITLTLMVGAALYGVATCK